MTGRPSIRLALAGLILPLAWIAAGAGSVRASTPNVLLVGTYNSIPGTYSTIQSAVDAAQPGDWILVGPGVYRETQDYTNPTWPAGVWITKTLQLRGMDRNGVIVDGTTGPVCVSSCSHPPSCSADPLNQNPGPSNQGRNGIEVYKANNVSIENLTVCNFLDGSGGNGNQIWWNGGDGGGQIGLSGYSGTYLTATSTYSSTTAGSLGPCCGVANPSGSYGIFSSDSTHGSWTNDYASNMSDSAYYIGACQQRCDVTMNQDQGEFSSLCLSSTNAGGYLLVEHTTCDNNKTGLVSNSQNNDDWPSPQMGACDSADPNEPQTGATGTASCTVWENNTLVNNNNPNVPGNGVGGLSGGGPVGTALILAGSSDVTVSHNDIENNDAWGELFVDLPDNEAAPSQVPTQCQGGLAYIAQSPPGPLCYYQAYGNMSLGNTFVNDGGGFPGQTAPNPGNGDIGMATVTHNPGNCFAGDTDAGTLGLTTDPAAMESNPAYAPVNGVCTTANAGDFGLTGSEAICASQLLAPCPTLNTLCQYNTSLPCIPAPTGGYYYPRPDPNGFTLTLPAAADTPTMPDPCAGVPANPWCSPASGAPEVPFVALPAAAGGLVVAAWALAGPMASRRRNRSITA